MEGNFISLLFVSGFRVLQTPLTQSTQLPAIREHFQNHHLNPARDGAKASHSGILRGFSSGIFESDENQIAILAVGLHFRI